jgi:hypothetical protein
VVNCPKSKCLTTDSNESWDFSANFAYYQLSDDTFILPILTLDKNKLHFEGRYNYEDRDTLSLFAGGNFRYGDKTSVHLSPMLGAATGNTDGIIPVFESTLNTGRWSFYIEQEYLIDLNNEVGNFYYHWIDLAYDLTNWLRLGISAQHTRLFESDAQIDHGFLIGLGKEGYSIEAYFYNLDTDDPFYFFMLGSNF